LRLSVISRRQAIAGAIAFGITGAMQPYQELKAQTAPEPEKQPAPSKTRSWLSLPRTPSLPPAPPGQLAEINGTSLFYAQYGAGPPVLLLHGGMGNSNYWGYQVESLAQNYCVTVMDTRGHGRSPVTSKAFSYARFAEDAVALLDYLNIGQSAIVGWSDGAITGLQLAMTKPERVTKLFAFGANASPDGLKPEGAKSPVFASYAARCQQEYERLSPHPEKWPELLAGLRAMWRAEPHYTRQQLAGVKVPTTVSDGECDEIIKSSHTKSIAAAMPNPRLAMLTGTSHFAMLQDPAQFNKALNEFLKV